MGYKQSDCITSSTRGEFTLHNRKVKQHNVNSVERWLTAISITLLLSMYQINLSRPKTLKPNSDSLPIKTQPQSLVK